MMAEDGKNQRSAAKGRFTRKLSELRKSIHEDKGTEVVRRNYVGLNDGWRNVEVKQDVYVTFLGDSEVGASEEWIAELQQLFSEAMERQIQHVEAKTTKDIVAKQELISTRGSQTGFREKPKNDRSGLYKTKYDRRSVQNASGRGRKIAECLQCRKRSITRSQKNSARVRSVIGQLQRRERQVLRSP